jgi:hypothetical protein
MSPDGWAEWMGNASAEQRAGSGQFAVLPASDDGPTAFPAAAAA